MEILAVTVLCGVIAWQLRENYLDKLEKISKRKGPHQ